MSEFISRACSIRHSGRLDAARRRALIGSRTAWAALSVWATLSVFVVLERALHRPNDVPLCVFTVGLLASG